MNWLKAKIREWLGLDLMPSVEMYKAMEKTQKVRHDELINGLASFQHNLSVVHGKIESLETLLQAAHVTRPVQAFEYTDWDSAQLAAMIEMQRNPEKEH